MLTVLITTIVVSIGWFVAYKYGIDKVKKMAEDEAASVEHKIQDKI